MKVIVSLINFILLYRYCFCIDFYTFHDSEIQAESATYGVSSRHDEFPFMTALGWKNDSTGEIYFRCGGMLITPNFVLTAAHCLFSEQKFPDVLKIGGNRLNSTHNEDHTLKNYFIHPSYDDTQAYNDVALLQLMEASKKTPVCLWSRQTLTTPAVTALGYGATIFAGSSTPILQKVNLIVVSTQVCRVYHENKRKFRYGISEAHLCAGDPGGRQDTCQGDSGGPIIVRSDYNQYAVGITSSGQACSGFPPAVYTRISSYIEWIEYILKQYAYYNYSKLKICD